ncbi:DUF6745 domain-containing protein [Rhodococcus tibetensis]|uniref:DUF6745 domain-containing protein n=1 Tax=Rhodococcus tibetensis TaxID=2965064 RepID=A0ABT1QCN2_9NOCA|nr:hypothetical protein [Rhodococcus sp. FXJ9.536]MCQ4120021.1 hypothetical protein [Rhodococcus sp. FXJ9.536]
MSAAPCRSVARHRATFTENADVSSEHLSVVKAVRDTWLGHGLCAYPSDRTTAESAVAQLYRQSGSREPKFVWVPSPVAGSDLIAAEGLSTSMSLAGNGVRCASARIATLLLKSRRRMDARIERRRSDWPSERWAVETARVQSTEDAARAGVSPDRIIRAAVWDSLHTTLFDGVAAAIRTLLPPVVVGVTWYGQQEAHRVAYYNTYRRLGLAKFHSDDDELLDANAALTGATGWWWAFDNVCVMAERPTALHFESIPGRVHNERRLHHSDAPAVHFDDGRAVFVQHGTIVPDWVVRDPTAERIARERNVEIRRCAIERIGWDTYIDTAGLALVDRADDPGNVGCTLQLYATPDGWGRSGRILLAVNGPSERDGHRRRYGLHVPGWISSALDAAGWTYGLDGADYARLVRRT